MDQHSTAGVDERIRLALEDATALGKLLETFGPRLLLVATSEISGRLQGKADPADIVQDVFLLAHRKFARFRGRSLSELWVWLRRILRRTLLNFNRRYRDSAKRQITREVDLKCAQGLQLAAPDNPEIIATKGEQARPLRHLLETVPTGARRAAEAFLETGSLSETARALGISPQGVQKSLRSLAGVCMRIGPC